MVRKCACTALADRLEILLKINIDFLILGVK
jgi:hypothetical protein